MLARRFYRQQMRKFSFESSVANLFAQTPSKLVIPVAGALGIGMVGLSQRVFVGNANQYLVRTGFGIRDLHISKWGFRWPFQKAMLVNVNPTTYTFQLHNMSKEKVEFALPVVMTIGPKMPDVDAAAFGRYCKLMMNMDQSEIETTVKGIIEGETRGLTARLSIEEMFNGKEIFRETVIDKLAPDLDLLGLTIYNANIQELRDYDANNKYFEYRKKRAVETANNEARGAVAEARKSGDIAVSDRERDTRISIARNEREAKVEEYTMDKQKLEAEAELAKQMALTKQIREVALMKATQEVLIEQQKLQREIEEKRYQQAQQATRADILAPAEAHAQATIIASDAALYAKSKEAEGLQKIMEAKAQGMERLFASCQGSPDLAKFYLGVDSGLWREVAQQSALAVQGLKPTITQWQTGTQSSITSPLVDMVQNVVPLYEEVMKHVKKQ